MAGLLVALAVATAAPAGTAPPSADDLALIDEGFRVFTGETFDGNGRTCGTCHIPSANFTITPADIAALDPAEKALVLASNVPELENATLVEKLALFNINEEHEPGNGLTPVGPFRASMAIGGLAFTTANLFCTVPEGELPMLTQCGSFSTVPNERANEPVNDGTRRVALGWAGDGGAAVDPDVFPDIPAAADCRTAVEDFLADPTDLTGTLRAFSLGAVRTHFPLRLDRVPGVDFRCPTPHELDALAAFQLWLGRRMELDLQALEFVPGRFEAGPGAAAEGKAVFMSDLATCNRCHVNAGANGSLGRVLEPEFDSDDPNPPPPAPTVPGANKNSHTSTDLLRIAEVSLNDLVAPVVIPRDAGDHRERGAEQADGFRAGGFNMQSLIEAPRKTGFFHNNGFIGSVEEAAAFYFTPTFDASQGGAGRTAIVRYCAKPGNVCPNETPQRLSGPDALAALGGPAALDKLGFFLRSLSAVYSLADCERLVEEIIQRTTSGLPTELPYLMCQFALDDVRTVLTGAKISPMPYQDVVDQLAGIEQALAAATEQGSIADRVAALENIDARLRRLRNAIATTPELRAAPTTARAPVLGTAVLAILPFALLAIGVAALRRPPRP